MRRGQATASVAPSRTPLTYDQLAEQIESTGRALGAAGFIRSDRVVLALPNGPEAATAFLSIAGACVAQQLLSEGRQVELILLLNAWAIRPTLWQKLKVMTPDGALSSMKFRFDRLWSRVRIGANKTGPAAHPLVPFGELPPHRFVEFVRKTHRMIGLSLDSRAVLFRPSDCRLDGMRGNFGWGGQFSRGLGTVKVPGDHVSMLSGPHLGTLVRF